MTPADEPVPMFLLLRVSVGYRFACISGPS
jgi:hypothetical protein